MGRWEPDPEQRIRAAAFELFRDMGFENTTVAAIAQRAGLTARTFFRYFPDKREVLFGGSEMLQQMMVNAIAQAPAGTSPFDTIAAALVKTGDFFDDALRPVARLRHSVIAATPDLQGRELTKMATLSSALAQALRERGVGEPDASLVAQAGIAVFRIAFAQWVDESERRGFVEVVNASLARLRTLTAR